MPVYKVFRGLREGAFLARPGEEYVAPSMHTHADGGSGTHEMLERVEAVSQPFGARLQRRRVVRIASATHLDHDVVDPSRRGVRHEVIDRALRRDLVADDPERLIHLARLSPRR